MTRSSMTSPDQLKELAPYLAMTAIAAVALLVVLLRFTPLGGFSGKVSVVSFDVIKYANSQRAVASTFLKPSADVASASELLLNLPTRTREAIEDEAGPGVLVVVKQAVVQGQTKDITDAVLNRLGMPTNVPTADGTTFTLDASPTVLYGITPPTAPANPSPSANLLP